MGHSAATFQRAVDLQAALRGSTFNVVHNALRPTTICKSFHFKFKSTYTYEVTSRKQFTIVHREESFVCSS